MLVVHLQLLNSWQNFLPLVKHLNKKNTKEFKEDLLLFRKIRKACLLGKFELAGSVVMQQGFEVVSFLVVEVLHFPQHVSVGLLVFLGALINSFLELMTRTNKK